MISAELLRKILVYDPLDGSWVWRINSAAATKAGDQAGHLDEKGYHRISIKGRNYRSHRLAWLYMTGEWPKNQIDHRDRNRANNRWANLRIATKSQNGSNTGPYRTNKCGLKGVHQRKNGRFLASIQVRKKKIHIGVFDTAEDAHAAYCRMSSRLHGEFGASS